MRPSLCATRARRTGRSKARRVYLRLVIHAGVEKLLVAPCSPLRETMAAARKSSMDHAFVLTFLVLAAIASLWLASEVLRPLALAVLLSFALAPLASFLERRGLP